MSPTTPTTELEAVNSILQVIGEQPVADLSLADTNADVNAALALLRNATRALLVKGWQFNVDQAVTLYRSPAGEIVLPTNVVRCTKADSCTTQDEINFSIRAQKLWDRTKNTFIWDQDLICDLTLLFPFEDLPEAARYYLAEKAGQRFQTRQLGSGTLYQFSQEDLADAKDTLQDYELDAGRYNFLTGSYDVAGIWGRDQ